MTNFRPKRPPEEKLELTKPHAPEFPVVEGFTCVSVLVPDDIAYVNLLQGFVAQMTNFWTWQGTDDERKARAALCQAAYTATDWSGCMDCSGVAECIENDPDVQAAFKALLIAMINSDIDVQESINNVYKGTDRNVPMPETIRERNLLPENPDCDLDLLFGQMVSLIENMNLNNLDAFQVVEEATNLGERATLLFSAIPVVETLPIDEAVSYVQNLWTNDLFEAYEANDTTSYREEMECELFCLARDKGCTLTMDDLIEYFAGRVGASPEDAFIEVIAYLIAGTWVGTEINDLFYWSQVMFLKYGNAFFKLAGLKPIETYFKLGEPDDNWMILCDDCPPERTVQVYTTLPNFGGTLVETLPLELGVAITYNAQPLGGGYWGLCFEPDGDYSYAYDIAPDPVATTNPAEIVWYVPHPDGTTDYGLATAENAADMPVTGDVRGIQGSALYGMFWQAFEPFTIEITFNLIP